MKIGRGWPTFKRMCYQSTIMVHNHSITMIDSTCTIYSIVTIYSIRDHLLHP